MFKGLFSKRTDFSPVSQSENCEPLASETQPAAQRAYVRQPFYSFPLWIITVLVSALLGTWLGSGHIPNLGAFCTKQTSQYSPLMRDIKLEYRTLRFNGSLLQENVYRQDRGPEVDAAWEALGIDYRPAIVSTKLGAKSGLTEDQVQISEKYGGGFPANVEGLHHLHCLNLLRKSLYFNFEYYHALGEGAFENDDRILKYHVTHCLDIIRQQLICTVDVGILGRVWWNREHPTVYPDFNTEHTCRNFEDVRKWAEEHQAPKDVPDDYFMTPRGKEDIYETIP